MLTNTMPERFWIKVNRTEADKCWLWTAAITRGPRNVCNYGHFVLNGRHEKAHRVAYMLTHGSIPTGKLILHTCDNPLCCNPAHLYAGTQVNNMQDRKNRGRQNYRVGSRHGRAKLTEEQVKEIRALKAKGELQYRLAERYGVSAFTLSLIVRRKIWKHI